MLTVAYATTLLLLAYCQTVPPGERLLDEHCATCHIGPAPASLPKSVWSRSVLPEMGARMGITTLGYDPLTELGPTEYAAARAAGHYPDQPTIDYDDWKVLCDYIVAQAPDTLPAPPPLAPGPLTGFTPTPLAIENKPGALITYLGPASAPGLVSGDGYGKLTVADRDTTVTRLTAKAPIVHYRAAPRGDLYLEIGNIYPTEASNGKLYRVTENGTETIADSLHRPVHFLSEDLDDDGQPEIVVCEYGHFTGALTLLQPVEEGYRRKRLSGAAGATRVVAEDLNYDGRQDLVYLHAQGDEGIDVLYQEEDGTFNPTSLLRFPSVWGTSWFELADIDADGDLDLLTVHGDNADYSNVRKPYHGLRIWSNDGDNRFTESYFQALPGATRVLARDFDEDGDLDVAVACNFADFTHQPEASLVYLENLGNDCPSFRARTTPAALLGRWLIMEAFDYDADGDEDILLGSFTLNPAPVPAEVAERWQSDSVDVLLLTNDLR